jgi:hypothetical protein
VQDEEVSSFLVARIWDTDLSILGMAVSDLTVR